MLQIVYKNRKQIVYITGSSGSIPIVVSAVSIAGTAVVNQTLTVSYTITGTPTVITRRWYRGATLISTSTSSDTYVLVAADAGQNITCNVDADGVSNATSNILTIVATFLDIYPASVGDRAYALNLLKGSYYGSPCINVLRDSDNAASDFGFLPNGELDTISLLAFVGAANGRVVKVYCQAGSGVDLIQTTPSSQARIVNAGVLDVIGSKAAIQFGVGGTKFLNMAALALTNDCDVIVVGKGSAATPCGIFTPNDPTASSGLMLWQMSSKLTAYNTGAASILQDSVNANGKYFINHIGRNTSAQAYFSINNVVRTKATTQGTTLQSYLIGTVDSFPFTGQIQAIIIYRTNKFASITAMTNTLNTYYGAF